jgi:hypothetical protein
MTSWEKALLDAQAAKRSLGVIAQKKNCRGLCNVKILHVLSMKSFLVTSLMLPAVCLNLVSKIKIIDQLHQILAYKFKPMSVHQRKRDRNFRTKKKLANNNFSLF